MDEKLTYLQAYTAMYIFLDYIWQRDYSGGTRKGPGDLPSLLGSMSLLPDGSTADPSYMQRWYSAVESDNPTKQISSTDKSITTDQAYYGMRAFIESIAIETRSKELSSILEELIKSRNNESKANRLYSNWESAIDEALYNDPDINLKFV